LLIVFKISNISRAFVKLTKVVKLLVLLPFVLLFNERIHILLYIISAFLPLTIFRYFILRRNTLRVFYMCFNGSYLCSLNFKLITTLLGYV